MGVCVCLLKQEGGLLIKHYKLLKIWSFMFTLAYAAKAFINQWSLAFKGEEGGKVAFEQFQSIISSPVPPKHNLWVLTGIPGHPPFHAIIQINRKPLIVKLMYPWCYKLLSLYYSFESTALLLSFITAIIPPIASGRLI